MHVSDLPEIFIVAVSSRRSVLRIAFETILGQAEGFTHCTLIEGEQNSGWILSVGGQPNFIKPDVPLTANQAVDKLMELYWQARYRPMPVARCDKGWLVCQGRLNGNTIAVVWSEWMEA